MDKPNLLIVAMADRCRAIIRRSDQADADLPRALHRKHLLWMCDRVELKADEWPNYKLHRWIGYIQGGMLANRILDFEGMKSMFAEAQRAYGITDDDIVDHLDPNNSFRLDIGGES